MSAERKEWSFLEDAWKYALVLTGREAAAIELLSASVEKLARRTDAADPVRARRILFASLFRTRLAAPPADGSLTPAESAAQPFHCLVEPGRSALTLLSLGSFAGEELASILGGSTSDLAGWLDDARRGFASGLTS